MISTCLLWWVLNILNILHLAQCGTGLSWWSWYCPQSVSPRILLANFSSNPVTTVISAYSPTNSVPEQEMESFYSDLSSAISAVPAHNFLPILGDFNGHLGKDTVPFSYHEECNRNGEFLHDLMEEQTLLATNTQFQKPPKRLWTWISPPDINRVRHKQQIDFILARQKCVTASMTASVNLLL